MASVWNALRAQNTDKLVEALKQHQADPNAPAQGDTRGVRPLHAACYQQHPALVEALLADPRTDPNATCSLGRTALHYLVTGPAQDDRQPALRCLQLLLDRGADPFCRDAVGSTGDCDDQDDLQDKRSVVYHALSRGRTDIAEVIAGRESTTGGSSLWSGAHAAALAGAVERVSILLARGTAIDARSTEQMTPLHVAAATQTTGEDTTGAD